jgi:hypothetical protein
MRGVITKHEHLVGAFIEVTQEVQAEAASFQAKKDLQLAKNTVLKLTGRVKQTATTCQVEASLPYDKERYWVLVKGNKLVDTSGEALPPEKLRFT